LAATLSKSVTLTLGPTLLVITWWKRRRLAWRDVQPLIPFVVIAVAVCPFSMKLESGFVGGEHYAPGDWRLSGLDRVLIAGRALWFYAAKLACPTGLAFSYDRWTVDGTVWWQYAFPVGAVLAFAAALALRPRWGPGPAAALMLFAGTLAPALGFINYYPMRYSYVADHFQYLASIALLALFVTGALAVGRRLGTVARRAAPVAVATLLLVLGVGTWQRSSVYKDPETLWRDTLAKRPNSFIALNNLGDELYRQRRIAEAIPFLTRALRVRPDSREIITNLANAYGTLGRNAEALQLQLAWLEKNPDDAVLHHNAAVTYYFGLHQPAEAMEHVGRALALVPDYAAARQLLRVMQSAGVTPTSSAPAAR
jgi:tetratricopeptide (TPR) repeat protein